MKTQRRHELKTNELVEWFTTDLPEFWRRNTRVIIYLAVVAVAVAVAVYYKRYAQRANAEQQRIAASRLVSGLARDKMRVAGAAYEGADDSGRLLVAASSLEGVAQASKDDAVAALALIKRAEALRAELHYRAVTLEREVAAGQIAQARGCYERALRRAGANVTLVAMAKFGLGLCAEELGDFDQAEKIYTELAEGPKFEWTVFAVQAKQRLETMADYQEEVFFPQVAAPVEKAAQAPDIEIQQPEVSDEPVPGQSDEPPVTEGGGADEPNNG